MEQIAQFALSAFVFSIPFEHSVQLDLGSISRLVGFLAMGTGIFAILEQKHSKPLPLFHHLFAAMIVWVALGYQWSIAPDTTFTRLTSLVQFWFLSFLIWQLVTTPAMMTKIMSAFFISNLIISLTIFFDFLESGSVTQRYTAVNANENGLAFMSSVAVSFAWFLSFKQQNNVASVLYRISVTLMVITLLLSGSRGGFLASIPIFVFILTTIKTSFTTTRIKLVALIAVIIVAIFYVIPEAQFTRIESIPDEIKEGTLSGRQRIWEEGFSLSDDTWILGSGYATFRSQGLYRPAHNTWFSLLASIGLIGMGLFGGMLLTVMYSLRALPLFERNLWFFVLFSWVVFSLSADLENQKITWLLFSLTITTSDYYTKARNKDASLYDVKKTAHVRR